MSHPNSIPPRIPSSLPATGPSSLSAKAYGFMLWYSVLSAGVLVSMVFFLSI